MIFAEHDRGKYGGSSYQLACCDGLAMDLLLSISRELKFEIDLYLVPDGYFGSRSVVTQFSFSYMYLNSVKYIPIKFTV